MGARSAPAATLNFCATPANAKPIAELEKLVLSGREVVRAIAIMPKLVIAAVNGPAAGGGMNLALACDIRMCSDQAKFAESFSQIGLFPDYGGTYFLPRIVGPTRAAELFYTAQMLSADDALKLGIVSRVIPQDQFEAETKKLAETWRAVPVSRNAPSNTAWSPRTRKHSKPRSTKKSACKNTPSNPKTVSKASTPSPKSANRISKATRKLCRC